MQFIICQLYFNKSIIKQKRGYNTLQSFEGNIVFFVNLYIKELERII